MTRTLHQLRSDRGSAPIEMAITGLAAIALIGLLTMGGRIAIAGSSLSHVAAAAARDASLARSAPQAVQAAHDSALAELDRQNLHCLHGPQITVDTSGFTVPPGTPATVRVDVTCVVSLSDTGFPGLPGSRTLHDHAVSPIDPFRSRP